MPAVRPERRPPAWLSRIRHAGLCLLLGWAAAAAALSPPPAPDWSAGQDAARMIVVAVANKPDPQLGAGATPRGYGGLPDYAGGERAVALAQRLSGDYGLRELSAWVIEPLRLRCMVYALPADADRDQLLQRLQQDKRVRIAQPLQEFETFSAPPASSEKVYNDPYLQLQHNFSAIAAAGAQRSSRGDGVRIALIDTGLDATHPELAGRILQQRDFVSGAAMPAERHGTEVAGVISALANNNLGIVGIAPAAQLLAYRACWSLPGDEAGARCNSFTLALALAAALSSDARIINLSLGGPADPLLQELLSHAIARGTIVVGAVPPSRDLGGFPLGVPGVIAVASSEDAPPDAPVLRAPGRDILTLEPGGRFDYASGSSLATAQVSAALALLLALEPKRDSAELYTLLSRSQAAAGPSIDVCVAVAALVRDRGHCQKPTPPAEH